MRGYQRRVIFLKNTGSPYFEEAYFLMSREGEGVSPDQSDMVFEANRIIKESLQDSAQRIRRERVRKKREFLVPFFLGALIPSLVALLLYAINVLFPML